MVVPIFEVGLFVVILVEYVGGVGLLLYTGDRNGDGVGLPVELTTLVELSTTG